MSCLSFRDFWTQRRANENGWSDGRTTQEQIIVPSLNPIVGRGLPEICHGVNGSTWDKWPSKLASALYSR